jgi:hypothetical protein
VKWNGASPLGRAVSRNSIKFMRLRHGSLSRMEERGLDLDYFIARFTQLADLASENGMSLAIIIESADPISRQSTVSKIFRGTVVTSIGLLQIALMDFQSHR